MKYRLVKPGFPLVRRDDLVASFLIGLFTSCSITRACSGPTSVGVTPLKRCGGKANWIRYPFSTVCRTHWDTFGSSFQAAKVREPASRGWPPGVETVARTPVNAYRQAGHNYPFIDPLRGDVCLSPLASDLAQRRGHWGRDRHCNSFLPQRGLPSEVLHPHVSDFFFWDLLAVSTDLRSGFDLKSQTSSAASGSAAGERERQRSPLSLPVWGAGTRRGLLPSSPLSPRAAREEPPERRRLLLASWNLSTTELTASPNRPEDESGASSRQTLSLYFISDKVSHRCPLSAATISSHRAPNGTGGLLSGAERQISGPPELRDIIGAHLLALIELL